MIVARFGPFRFEPGDDRLRQPRAELGTSSGSLPVVR
jgi:hypothetical protein